MITKLIFPALAIVLLTGCISSAEKKAKEQNNRRLINSLQYPGTARLKYTLNRGGDPNFKDDRGVPAFVKAVALQKIDHVKLLLEHGADVNAADMDGETALFPAVASGNIELVEFLISKGASLNIRSKKGKTPAMEAARLGQLKMLEYLIEKGADINAVDDRNAGLATYAAMSSNAIPIFEFLEEKGLKIDLDKTSLMASPFLLALFFDQEETAIYLLPKMQDLNANSRMRQIGKLAVYYAISHNKPVLLKALIDKKLELNYDEPFYYNIVKQINVTGIYKLAARNDIINKRYTPLMYACIFGRPQMVEMLVKAGANPLIENNEGQIAMDYAKDRETTAAIKSATKKWYNNHLRGKQRRKGLIIEKNKGVKRATIFDL